MEVSGGWPKRPLPPLSEGEVKGCVFLSGGMFVFAVVIVILLLLCCGVLG